MTDLLLSYLTSADQILDLIKDYKLSGEQIDQAVQAAAKLAWQWQDWTTAQRD